MQILELLLLDWISHVKLNFVDAFCHSSSMQSLDLPNIKNPKVEYRTVSAEVLEHVCHEFVALRKPSFGISAHQLPELRISNYGKTPLIVRPELVVLCSLSA